MSKMVNRKLSQHPLLNFFTSEVLSQSGDRHTGFIVNCVGDFQGTADGMHVLFGPVDSHRLVNGGVEVSDRHSATCRIGTAVIAGPDDLTASDADAAEDHRTTVTPMIASLTLSYNRRDGSS